MVSWTQGFIVTCGIIPAYLALCALAVLFLSHCSPRLDFLQTVCPIARRVRMRYTNSSMTDSAVKLINVLTFLLYPSVAMKIFQILQCVEASRCPPPSPPPPPQSAPLAATTAPISATAFIAGSYRKGFIISWSALGVPIGFAMLATAVAGFFIVGRSNFAETQFSITFIEQGTSFVFVAVPLYFMMGQIVQRTNIAADLYECVYRWLGRLPGGLAISSVVACGGFGAVSGGSVTAVATEEPETAANTAHPSTEAEANPPRKRPTQANAAS